MSPHANTPAPSGSTRDDSGRLIGLVFDSAPPPPTPQAHPCLIAVDSSAHALRAVAHAAEQAALMHACALHLVHVQPWLAKEAAEGELAQRALEATAAACALLDARAFPWRLHVAMGSPAEQIIATASAIGGERIVIGSRGLNEIEGLLLGSVAYKLIHLAPMPVVIVR